MDVLKLDTDLREWINDLADTHEVTVERMIMGILRIAMVEDLRTYGSMQRGHFEQGIGRREARETGPDEPQLG